MVKLCEYSPKCQSKIIDAVTYMFEERHMDFDRIAFELNLKYWIVVEAYKEGKKNDLIQKGNFKEQSRKGYSFCAKSA